MTTAPTEGPVLSVVIPVYNEEEGIERSIGSIESQAGTSPFRLELIVVDDGSTDGTAARARTAGAALGAHVITQENRGRFAARRTGLTQASGAYVLFIDSRVTLHDGALAFLGTRVAAGEEIWNAHVHIETRRSRYGQFWRVLTELAFSGYFDEPRTTSFGLEDFDRFPKGTTCFFAPADLMREAFSSHRSFYEDQRDANDDTPILRWIAARTPIHISPDFACSYRPRASLQGFVRHAFHRGIVFVDGHARAGSRFLPVIAAFYPASALAAAVSVRAPRRVALGAMLGSLALAGVARRRGHSPGEAASFAGLAPVYALAHGAGMWRGAWLAARAAVRSSRGQP